MTTEPKDDTDTSLPDIIDRVQAMDLDAVPAIATPAGHLAVLTSRARDYVEAASSANTHRAYSADWRHFASWCRRQGFDPLIATANLVRRALGVSPAAIPGAIVPSNDRTEGAP